MLAQAAPHYSSGNAYPRGVSAIGTLTATVRASDPNNELQYAGSLVVLLNSSLLLSAPKKKTAATNVRISKSRLSSALPGVSLRKVIYLSFILRCLDTCLEQPQYLGPRMSEKSPMIPIISTLIN